MSKQKIWSDFNSLECGKTEKIFAGTWTFNKRVEIFSSQLNHTKWRHKTTTATMTATPQMAFLAQ